MPNLIDEIRPQLAEYIDNRFFDGYMPDELLRPLKTPYWYGDVIYENLMLQVDYADLSVKGWLNAAEYLGGDVDALNDGFIAAVREAIERQWEIRMDDAQRDYNRELERTAGKDAAA